MVPYQIFLVEPLGPFDEPLVITTAMRNAGGYPKGEWFIVIPDEGHTYFAQKTRFHYKEFPEGGIKLDDGFIQREMLDQAKLRLRKYIHENNITIGHGVSRWSPSFTAAETSILAHCWVRGSYAEQLKKVYRATDCSELQHAINWVSTLDEFKRQDI